MTFHADRPVLVSDGSRGVGLALGLHETGDIGFLLVVGLLDRLLGAAGGEAGEEGGGEEERMPVGLVHRRHSLDTFSR